MNKFLSLDFITLFLAYSIITPLCAESILPMGEVEMAERPCLIHTMYSDSQHKVQKINP